MGIADVFRAIGNNMISARDALKIGWSLPPKRTSDLWTDMYHKTPMLDPVHMIASDVATTNFKIYNKQQYRKDPQNAEPYGDNPIYDLLELPMPDHPEIDWYQLMYLTSVYYEIIGDSFWLIDRDTRGKPVGIYIIPPTWMLLTPTMNIPYFRVQPMGNTSHRYFNADPKDVVWFKAPDVTNPYGRGRARAEAIGDEVETSEYSAKYAKNFFYNDATPPIILEMPGISPEGAKVFKEDWMQKLGGYLQARKPAIVAQKDFKVHQLGTSPKEMDFIESRKYLIQMANEHFCVPPEMRGNLQNSNRATIDSAFYLWSKNVVTKRLRTLASTLNTQFVPMFDKNSFWKFDDVVPEDNEAKMKIANDGLEKGTLTRNEWRKIASSCGIQLVPDEARGDVYLTGLMIQEVPAFDKGEPEPPEPEKTEPVTPEDMDEGSKGLDLDIAIKEITALTETMEAENKRKSVGQKIAEVMPDKSSFSEAQKVAIWKAYDSTATALEDPFKKSVKKFAGVQQKQVEDVLGSMKKADDVKPALDKVFTDESDQALKRALAPAWLGALRAGRTHAKKLLADKKADTDGVANEWFNKWVDSNGLVKAKQINTTTYEALRDKLIAVISGAIDEGVTEREMAKRILETCDGVFENMTKARANLIARTEAGGSVNAGSFAGYKIEGVEKKEWLAIRDKRTRDAHYATDGQIVDIDKPFDVMGEPMMYPGDPKASAGDICNCRCAIAPVISD